MSHCLHQKCVPCRLFFPPKFDGSGGAKILCFLFYSLVPCIASNFCEMEDPSAFSPSSTFLLSCTFQRFGPCWHFQKLDLQSFLTHFQMIPSDWLGFLVFQFFFFGWFSLQSAWEKIGKKNSLTMPMSSHYSYANMIFDCLKPEYNLGRVFG